MPQFGFCPLHPTGSYFELIVAVDPTSRIRVTLEESSVCNPLSLKAATFEKPLKVPVVKTYPLPA